MQVIKSPALRYHGAKFRLAPWVIEHIPPHKCYVEPFGGGAGVLLRKPRSYAEVYNDLDSEIVNFFRVLRDPAMNARLRELCELTPFARDEFSLATERSTDPVEQARRTAIRSMMGFGSAGATQSSTGFRVDTKREYVLPAHLWLKYPENLSKLGSRFAGVLIENRPAIQVMRQHDGVDTVHYCDPPYVHETRNKRGNNRYRHEMHALDHYDLLVELTKLQGSVVLSGYDNELYNDVLIGWRKETKKSRISAGRGTVTKEECLWIKISE